MINDYKQEDSWYNGQLCKTRKRKIYYNICTDRFDIPEYSIFRQLNEYSGESIQGTYIGLKS